VIDERAGCCRAGGSDGSVVAPAIDDVVG